MFCMWTQPPRSLHRPRNRDSRTPRHASGPIECGLCIVAACHTKHEPWKEEVLEPCNCECRCKEGCPHNFACIQSSQRFRGHLQKMEAHFRRFPQVQVSCCIHVRRPVWVTRCPSISGILILLNSNISEIRSRRRGLLLLTSIQRDTCSRLVQRSRSVYHHCCKKKVRVAVDEDSHVLPHIIAAADECKVLGDRVLHVTHEAAFKTRQWLWRVHFRARCLLNERLQKCLPSCGHGTAGRLHGSSGLFGRRGERSRWVVSIWCLIQGTL